jgi:hypothetical protein
MREASRPIRVVKEDVLAVIASGNDMIQGAGVVNTWFARHGHPLWLKHTQCQYFITIA